MDRGGGQDPQVSTLGAQSAQMGKHSQNHVVRVQHRWQKWQAMPRKVPYSLFRYHNHLDSAIVTTEWLPEEEEILLAEHEEIGNKWSAISQKLPGRYCLLHPDRTTASRTTSTPSYVRAFADSTRSFRKNWERNTTRSNWGPSTKLLRFSRPSFKSTPKSMRNWQISARVR